MDLSLLGRVIRDRFIHQFHIHCHACPAAAECPWRPLHCQANSRANLFAGSTWLLPWLLQSWLHVGDAHGATGTCLIQVPRGPLGSMPGTVSRRWRHEASTPAAALVALKSSSNGGSRASAAATDQHSTRLLARRKEVPAGWFGSFSKEESSFDHDGIGDSDDFPEKEAAKVSEHGNSVNMAAQEDPFYENQNALPSEWFEESISGGSTGAWRTGFPSAETFHNEGVKAVPWIPSRGGRQKMTYIPSTATSVGRMLDMNMKKDAPWFDQDISNYDEFGRNRPPSENSDRFYWDWEKKSWSVPLTCSQPGCVANATLKTFDAKALQHAKCRLYVGVHLTDFDDEYSREFVEWIIVNGARINSRCDPMGKGCNTSVVEKDRGLHPCVSDYPLDNLLNITEGTELKIAGKISEMVDECPVNNNLLSGEARVTCYVKPHPPKPRTPSPVRPGTIDPTNCSNSTPLQCWEPGCTANATAMACRPPEKGQKCLLSVKIWQTDFDGDHGSKEVVEWVKVNGKNISKDLKPGRNPCKEVYEGKPASAASLAARNGGVPSAIGSAGRVGVADPGATADPGIGLDAQSAALLAPLPDDPLTPTVNCRRRVLGQPQANSLLHGAMYTSRRRRKEEEERRPEITHLRADPDEMKEIVTGQDVTEDVLAGKEFLVDAKISRMVDECAKDGFLLNAQVFIECK